MNRSIFLIITLVSVFFSSCGSANTPDTSAGSRRDGAGARDTAEAKEVRVSTAEKGQIAQTIVVTGTLAAQDQITASVKVAGRVESVDVDFGSHVTKGQVIAHLDPKDFRLRMDQASAGLKQARARLGLSPDGEDEEVVPEKTALVRESRAQFEDARLTSERMKTLWDQKVIPKTQLDSALAILQVAEGRYDEALEEIRNRQGILLQRESELESAKQQLADTILYAPVDGLVRERLISPGNYVSAGTPMFTIVIVHPLRLRLAVPERGANGARVGAPVRVTVEGDPTTYTGKLVRVSPSIQEQSRTLTVEAEIPNEEGVLRPGSFATAEIATTGEKPTIFVPTSSLTSFAGLEKVMSVKDGKAVEIRVKTGRRDSKRIEIVEGLEAGVSVILDPGNLVPGQPVTVRRE